MFDVSELYVPASDCGRKSLSDLILMSIGVTIDICQANELEVAFAHVVADDE